ncbi:hypothetical protein ATKI12_9012 [Kitasatospora sp. Ki12]
MTAGYHGFAHRTADRSAALGPELAPWTVPAARDHRRSGTVERPSRP